MTSSQAHQKPAESL